MRREAPGAFAAPFVVLVALFALFAFLAPPVMAQSSQSWPARPIRFVLPFAAGGGGDTFARPLAQWLGESLGQPIVIENIAGAAAIVGTEVAARAPADGYTFLMLSNAHAINETLQPKLSYNLLRDFTPVTQLCSLSLVLVVHPSLQASTVPELVALAKKQPGKLVYASSGIGSIYHLPMELFKSMAGVDILHVPYKSSANARTDVISGQLQMMFDSLATMQPFIQSNRVRAIAVAGAKRTGAAPDLPTISESGLSGFEGDGWLGFAAPAGTPRAIVERLQSEIAKILARPEVKATYIKAAADPVASTPADFGIFLRSEVEKWGRVVKASGAKAE